MSIISKQSAYAGKIGEARKQFCKDYINKKEIWIAELSTILLDSILRSGKSTPCIKDCIYATCCNEYVEANIQEIESIVYYLYNNKIILKSFLNNYEIWKKKEKKILPIYNEYERLKHKYRASNFLSEKELEQFKQILPNQYYRLNIKCPFLENNHCLIYNIRPISCSAYYSVGAKTQCHPNSKEMPELVKADTQKYTRDCKYYYGKLDHAFYTLLPMGVYNVLNEGYTYLSRIKGIEDIGTVQSSF